MRWTTKTFPSFFFFFSFDQVRVDNLIYFLNPNSLLFFKPSKNSTRGTVQMLQSGFLFMMCALQTQFFCCCPQFETVDSSTDTQCNVHDVRSTSEATWLQNMKIHTKTMIKFLTFAWSTRSFDTTIAWLHPSCNDPWPYRVYNIVISSLIL